MRREDIPNFPHPVDRISPAVDQDIWITLMNLLHLFKDCLPILPPASWVPVLSIGDVPYPGMTLNLSNEFSPQFNLASCPVNFWSPS